MRKLTDDDCLFCMKGGDFPESVRSAQAKVAVILTQSWCPQWLRMRAFLDSGALPEDGEAFYVEYDKTDFFREFMAFKENVFGNDQIPYVRYYHDGRFGSSGNFADRAEFLSRLEFPKEK